MDWPGAIELVGGLLGLAGSIILALPALFDLKNRRFWDQIRRLDGIRGTTPADAERLRSILLDSLLGRHRRHVRCTVGGATLLAIGFGLIAAAGGVRVFGP